VCSLLDAGKRTALYIQSYRIVAEKLVKVN